MEESYFQTFQLNVPIVVCNVDITDSHQEFHQISHLFRTIQLYENITDHKQVLENKHQKEKSDFVGCVSRLMSAYPPDGDNDLLLVLEDDALIVEDFFITLSSILGFHLPSYQQGEWLDIKLYTPPKWAGFGLDWIPALELFAESGLASVLYLFITAIIMRYFFYISV